MEGRIFSIGYQERSLAEFLGILTAHSVDLLVDVRETPWSRRREYAKTALALALRETGVDYVHARFAGNPQAIRRRAQSHEACLKAYAEHLARNPAILDALDREIGARLRAGRNVCLLCYERHPDDCHRKVLIEAWAAARASAPERRSLGARRRAASERTDARRRKRPAEDMSASAEQAPEAADPSRGALHPMLGRRIHIVGHSGCGKSTLAARLAHALGLPLVELDALNWEPDWVGLNDVNPEEFERRIGHATRGDAWIVAGSYARFAQRVFWPRLETVVWLDLPLPLLLGRVLRRSWRRWRTRELLWGTNYERFWPQWKVWRKEDSLVWWVVVQGRPKRRRILSYMLEPKWAHIRFVRLTSRAEIERFAAAVEAEAGRDDALCVDA